MTMFISSSSTSTGSFGLAQSEFVQHRVLKGWYQGNNIYDLPSGGSAGIRIAPPTPASGNSSLPIQFTNNAVQIQRSHNTLRLEAFQGSVAIYDTLNTETIATFGRSGLTFSLGSISGITHVSASGNISGSSTSTGSFGTLRVGTNVGSLSSGLVFGDGDTGFYEHADDDVFFKRGGNTVFRANTSSQLDFGVQHLFFNTTGGFFITTGAGSAAAPNYVFRGDQDTGMFRIDADRLGFSAGGALQLEISSNKISGSAASTGSFGRIEVHSNTGSFAHIENSSNIRTAKLSLTGGGGGDTTFVVTNFGGGNLLTLTNAATSILYDGRHGQSVAGLYFNVNNTAMLGNLASSATVPAFKFKGDTDTGLGRADSNQLSLITGGVEALRVTETLISGSATSTGSFGELQVRGAGQEKISLFGNAQQFINFGDAADSNTGMIQYDHNNNQFQFYANATNILRVLGSGFVLPSSNEGVSLGSTSLKWKELVVNHVSASGNISGSATSTGSFGKIVIPMQGNNVAFEALNGNFSVANTIFQHSANGGNLQFGSQTAGFFHSLGKVFTRKDGGYGDGGDEAFKATDHPVAAGFWVDSAGNMQFGHDNGAGVRNTVQMMTLGPQTGHASGSLLVSGSIIAKEGDVSGSATSTGSFGVIQNPSGLFLGSTNAAHQFSQITSTNHLFIGAGASTVQMQNDLIPDGDGSQNLGSTLRNFNQIFARTKVTGSSISTGSFGSVFIKNQSNLQFGSINTRIRGDNSNNVITFMTNNTERVRINDDGVGIGGDPVASNGLTIHAVNPGLTLRSSNTTGACKLRFADTGDADIGMIEYGHSSNAMVFSTGDAEAFRLDTNQNAIFGGSKISGSATSTGSFGELQIHDKIGINTADAGAVSPASPHTGAKTGLMEIKAKSSGGDAALLIRRFEGDGAYGMDLWTDTNAADSYIDQRGGISGAQLYIRTATHTSAVNAAIFDHVGNVEFPSATTISGSATSTGSFGNVYVGKGGAQFQNTKFAVVDNNSTEYAPMGGSSNTANAMIQFTNTNTSATAPHSLIHFRLDKSGGDGYVGFMTSTSTGNIEHFVVGNQVDGEIIRGASGGNVGIGDSNPSGKLVVSGSGTINLHIDNSGTGDTGLLGKRNATSIFGMFDDASDSKLRIVNYQAEPIEFSVDRGGTETIVMTMMNSGRVGIGNTSPESILDVSGSNSFGQLQIRDGNNSIYRRFFVSASGAHGLGTLHIQNRAFPGSGTGDVYTHFKSSVAGGTTRMNVMIDGKLGLGTTDTVPEQAIHIKAANPKIQFQDTSVSNLKHVLSGGDGDAGMAYEADVNNVGAGYHAFKMGGAERIRFIENGSVGIADTSPAQPLVVSGSSKGLLSVGLAGGGSRVTIGDTSMDSALHMRRSSNGAADVQVLQLGSSLHVGATSNVINTLIQSNTSVLTVGSSKVTSNASIEPTADASFNLGAADKRWANIFSADLQLSNEGTEGNEVDGTTGSWTIQEGEDDLYLLNRKNGKKYKFKLEEIT
tara:strand:+ start:5836 stop:10356 length:4521 start_codon:yes stop_codon:yes gene_type:complete